MQIFCRQFAHNAHTCCFGRTTSDLGIQVYSKLLRIPCFLPGEQIQPCRSLRPAAMRKRRLGFLGPIRQSADGHQQSHCLLRLPLCSLAIGGTLWNLLDKSKLSKTPFTCCAQAAFQFFPTTTGRASPAPARWRRCRRIRIPSLNSRPFPVTF